MSFLHELESVSSLSYAKPSASNCSVTSNSGNSSITVMPASHFHTNYNPVVETTPQNVTIDAKCNINAEGNNL